MKLLILQNSGRYSRLKLDDFQGALAALGHSCATLELSALSQVAAQGKFRDLIDALRGAVRRGELQAILAYSSNALSTFPAMQIDGKPGYLPDLLGIPFLNYWPDPLLETHDFLPYTLWRFERPRLCGPHRHHLVKDAAAAEELREFYEIPNVHGLPLAVNAEQFRPHPGSRDVAILFVGGSDPAPEDAASIGQLPPFDRLIAERAAQARARIVPLCNLLPYPPQLRDEIARLATSVADAKQKDPSRAYWSLCKEVDAQGAPGAALGLLRKLPDLYYQLRNLCISAYQLPRGHLVRNVADRFETVVLGNETWQQWKVNYQGWADYEQQARWYSRAKIGLNHTLAWDEVGVNYKVFEITACRTLCVTNYRAQLEELFDIDRELVVYRSHDELIDKLDFYLRHDAERERIAEAGYRRTLAHHTFRQRTAEMLARVGLESGLQSASKAGVVQGPTAGAEVADSASSALRAPACAG